MRTARQQFEQALRRLRQWCSQGTTTSWQCALQAEYEAAALASWRAEHPRSRMTFLTLRKRHFDAIRPVFERFQAIASTINARHVVQRHRLHTLLDRLALRVPVVTRSAVVWRRVWSDCSSSYSTQGFGACKYARNSVENQADIARAAGIPVVIRSQVSKYPCALSPFNGHRSTGSITHYEVWCPVYSHTDVELLRRKPGPSVVEQVRLCWKRGVNPRVYSPFLPPDFEAKHGLDCFGGVTGKAMMP